MVPDVKHNYRQATFEVNGVRYYVAGYFDTGNAYCTVNCGPIIYGKMNAQEVFSFTDLSIETVKTINQYFKDNP